jgi:hypothetical protein
MISACGCRHAEGCIAGPTSAGEAMTRVTNCTDAVLDGLLSVADFERAANDVRTTNGQTILAEWLDAAGAFETAARRVLGTESLNGPSLRLWRRRHS